MAMFSGPEGSPTFRLNVAFTTYRITASSSSRKTRIFGMFHVRKSG
jgi:hypothetical protein